MSTVVSRCIRAVPFRSARDTWQLIVDILMSGGGTAHGRKLESVAGVAAAIITEKSPEQAPIVVCGGGPRVRIYCLYAESGSKVIPKRTALSFDRLERTGPCLPCPIADLTWVTEALGKRRYVCKPAMPPMASLFHGERQSVFELNIGEFMKS